MYEKYKDFLYPLFSAITAILFFFIFFAKIFPPANTNWIFNDGWDTIQHQLGWMFYRSSDLAFPIGINKSLGYPIGSSLYLTDSIPLLGIPLKLVGAWLPAIFQYLGIWILLSFILQGVIGYYLVKLFLKKPVLAFLGSQFFILSPILINRIAGHASLTAHWVILLALYWYFQPHTKWQFINWSITLCLALLIHPYLFFMAFAVMAVDMIKLGLPTLKSSYLFCLFLIIQFAVIVFIGWISGIFQLGHSNSRGYGVYSLNLDSLINPYWWGRWSFILPSFETTRYQYEGFAYLGAGLLTLLAIAIILKIAKPVSLIGLVKKHWPILLMCFTLTALAVTNQVYFHNSLLFTFPVPHAILPFLEIVRSSGRLFWPVYYIIILFALLSVRSMKTSIAVVFLVAILIFQYVDLYPGLMKAAEHFDSKSTTNILVSPQWNKLAKYYEHISFVDGYRNPEMEDFKTSRYLPIAIYAASNGMSLNDGYFARPLNNIFKHLTEETSLLKSGIRDNQTLYIFKGDHAKYLIPVHDTDLFENIDGYFILAPDFLNKK